MIHREKATGGSLSGSDARKSWKINVSVTKRIVFGAAASWLSRGVTIVLSLVVMPVLFHHLGKEELGVWFLLAQTSALLLIFDFGLSFTLTRWIALAKGKSGSDPRRPSMRRPGGRLRTWSSRAAVFFSVWRSGHF